MRPAADSLLFDLDGTLTDNLPGISRSIVFALERMDLPRPTPEALRRCIGPPLRESFAWLLDTSDAGMIETAIGHYRERYSEVGWRENLVYDGIEDMLAGLARSSCRMFLCTSKPEVFARRIVQLFGLSLHFDGIYGADLAGNFDDKARLLAHVLRSEGLEPERAVMIGDRAQDLRAARMNGARAVGVLWGYGSREELAGADALASTPAGLSATLQALPG